MIKASIFSAKLSLLIIKNDLPKSLSRRSFRAADRTENVFQDINSPANDLTLSPTVRNTGPRELVRICGTRLTSDLERPTVHQDQRNDGPIPQGQPPEGHLP